MSFFLIGVGFIVNFVCGIWILIQAFRKSTGWGLAVIFIPFASLFFIINNWSETKKPFLGSVASVILIILGLVIAPTPEPDADAAETRTASRSTAPSSADDDEDAPAANYASAAAPVTSYQPPRTAYQPAAYTPSYAPPMQPAPAVVTDPQAVEDEWSRKPKFEQVYVDRATNQFYLEKCRKRPEDTYRIPKSVALMQGMTEAPCR